MMKFVRSTKLALAWMVSAAWFTLASTAAMASPPGVDRPAPPSQVRSCAVARAASEPTADVPTVIADGARIGGCVADTSGIAALVISWRALDSARHGRICTDPVVAEDGTWSCVWDARRLPDGEYEARMLAVDAVGNVGSFTRRYTIDRSAAAPAPAEPDDSPAGPAEGTETPGGTTAPLQPSGAAPQDPASDQLVPDDLGMLPDLTGAAPIEELIRTQVRACEDGGTDDFPTDLDTVRSQIDQATMVLACIQPVLDALELTDVDVDTVPRPPVIVVPVDTIEQRDRLRDLLPDTVAGVEIRIELPADIAVMDALARATASDAAAA